MSFLLAERDDHEASSTRTQGRVIALALLITLLATVAALTGCGGGDPGDEIPQGCDAVYGVSKCRQDVAPTERGRKDNA